MKSTLQFFAVLSIGLLCMSCETTGDPSAGGIFWSERKAQDRLAERQGQLENIERQTATTQRKSTDTQRRINELQNRR